MIYDFMNILSISETYKNYYLSLKYNTVLILFIY